MATRDDSPPRTKREEHYETQRASSSSESPRSRQPRLNTGNVVVPQLVHRYEHGNGSKATISTGSDSSTIRRASRQSNPKLAAQSGSNTIRPISNNRPGSRWPNRDRAIVRSTTITKTGSPQRRMYRPRAPGPITVKPIAASRFANVNNATAAPPAVDQHDLFRQASVEEIKEANRQRTRLQPQHIVTAAIGAKSSRQQPSYASIQSNAFDIPRPPPPPRASASTLHLSSLYQEHENSLEEQLEAARREQSSSLGRHSSHQRRKRRSNLATELYTISYLIFFSFWGVLARLGVQWLTFYPGAPATIPVLWANVGGSLIFGFLSEDRKLFREEWGDTPGFTNSFKPSKSNRSRSQLQARSEKRRPHDREGSPNDSSEERLADPQAESGSDDGPSPDALQNHAKVKKSIPLYIGLATGFCGSFTSFSSFMRDCFLAISNDLPSPINHPYPDGAALPSTTVTVARNGGYSFEALLAILLMTIGLSLAALKAGKHLALALDRFTPIIRFRFLRHVLDKLVVFLAFACWLGAVLLAILPPDRPGGPAARPNWSDESWRGEALFAVVFAPLGCLLRFYASKLLNPIAATFPLGTFAVNVFGTAVEAMCFDVQHVSVDAGGGILGAVGGGRVGCQVLQGVMDGFCGCLTTVSTWVAELDGLKRRRDAWRYGGASVAVGLAVVIVIMGSVRWTVGFADPACVT